MQKIDETPAKLKETKDGSSFKGKVIMPTRPTRDLVPSDRKRNNFQFHSIGNELFIT